MPTRTVANAGSSVAVSTYTASSSPILSPSGSMTFSPRQSRRFSAGNMHVKCPAPAVANQVGWRAPASPYGDPKRVGDIPAQAPLDGVFPGGQERVFHDLV